MAWRFYLKSKGQYNAIPSQQVATSCKATWSPGKDADGCQGGQETYVFESMAFDFLPAAIASPYTAKSSSFDVTNFCNKPTKPSADALQTVRNSISYRAMLNDKAIDDQSPNTLASTQTLGEGLIMLEIYENGPGTMGIQWDGPIAESYPNNDGTCNGIQTDRTCLGGKGTIVNTADGKFESCKYDATVVNHAVAIIGWGVDTTGCPSTDPRDPSKKNLPGPIKYWIVQNSHGEGTGDCEGVGCGFYKVERGANAFNMESAGLQSASPDLGSMACIDIKDPKQWCLNGGAFDSNCKCICPAGFGGDTCADCSTSSKQCKNSAGVVVKPILTTGDAIKGVPASCKCPCDLGYWAPPNLRLTDDCAIAVGIWPASTGQDSGPLKLSELQETAQAYAVTGSNNLNATFHFRFTKDAAKTNAGSPPYINNGDFLVAVPVGTKPWTPQLKWEMASASANICGPKKTESGKLVSCPIIEPAWPGNKYVQSMGTLSISTPGIYDVYFVKYNGKSEFGVDKGFGKDFALLPQRIQVLLGEGPERARFLTRFRASCAHSPLAVQPCRAVQGLSRGEE